MRLHSKKVETINNSISIKNIEKLIYFNDNTVNTRSAIFEFDHIKWSNLGVFNFKEVKLKKSKFLTYFTGGHSKEFS